jgi:hypothetical protein
MVVTTSGAARTAGPGDDHDAGLVTISAEGWSVVSAFKLVANRVSPRLDPGPRSSHMMSFTPVYIHVGR